MSINVQKLISEVASRNRCRVEDGDPIFAVATVNELMLDEVVRGLIARGRVVINEFEESARKVESHAGKMLAEDYLKYTREAPLSRFEIKAGWEIPAALEQGLNSDLPGELKALVMSNVYDAATGQYLLIPQGARLVGAYNSRVGYGQSGVQVAWHRVIFPGGSAIDLNGMAGLDAQGNAGLRDKVDNHDQRLFGFAVLTSLFDAALAVTQSRQSVLVSPSATQEAESAAGREVSQLGTQIARTNLNVQLTIRIPAGYKFNVRVNRDTLVEEPYRPVQPLERDGAKK